MPPASTGGQPIGASPTPAWRRLPPAA